MPRDWESSTAEISLHCIWKLSQEGRSLECTMILQIRIENWRAPSKSKQGSPVPMFVVEVRASEPGFAILVSPLTGHQQKAIKTSKLCVSDHMN